jgi:hypothetical protein
MKDEEPWQDTLRWARSLTNRAIGQLWVHHTGHDDSRSYGTKTREWQLDTVILLKRIGDRAPRLATMHMVGTIPSGLTWLLIAGCAVAAWVVGYGMGYRRGVTDAIRENIPKADHRFNGE